MLLGISWLWWTIGGSGTVVVALLAWLAPTLLVEIVKALFSFFVTTRLGNVIAAAAIAFFVADTNRSLRDEHEFAARTAQFEQAQKDRDSRIAQETRDEVWKDIANATAANAQTDQDVKEFHNALPPVPFAASNPFRVGADSCRLRHIAGENGCGSASLQGVPASRNAAQGAEHQSGHRLPGLVQRVLGRHRQGKTGAGS